MHFVYSFNFGEPATSMDRVTLLEERIKELEANI